MFPKNYTGNILGEWFPSLQLCPCGIAEVAPWFSFSVLLLPLLSCPALLEHSRT